VHEREESDVACLGQTQKFQNPSFLVQEGIFLAIKIELSEVEKSEHEAAVQVKKPLLPR
jgi:hypothetical protein